MHVRNTGHNWKKKHITGNGQCPKKLQYNNSGYQFLKNANTDADEAVICQDWCGVPFKGEVL
jgi:hypothetical protein